MTEIANTTSAEPEPDMRRKRVRVVGNCQASAVANLYRDFVGAPNLEEVVYVDDLGLDAEGLRQAVGDADVLIVQERDFKHGLTKAELGGGLEVHAFPMVLAGFLWPYANEPHVSNVAERPVSDGPYPSQLSDSYLNRLIRTGVSPEEALDRYLKLDIAKAASLDRMLEIYLDRQRERDVATGFDLASAIERDFRKEKLFLTAEHPNARLFGLIASQLFQGLGAPQSAIDAAVGSLRVSPFEPDELPIHPGVIAHFGLKFADADTRYGFFHEGRFTFSEYVLRYMRYESNAELRHGIYMAERGDAAAALVGLERGLDRSPASSRGWRAKGKALDRLGRSGEALEAFRRAVVLAPLDPDAYVDLARSLMYAGALCEAEATADKAVAAAPTHAPAYLILGEIRTKAGDFPGAVAFACEAIRLLPGRAHSHLIIGIALSLAGDLNEAERHAERCVQMEPSVADHRNLLAEIYERQGRRADALAVLQEGEVQGWLNDQSFSLLGNFWLRDGELARAEAAFRQGAELYGATRPDLVDGLAQVRALRAKAQPAAPAAQLAPSG